MNTHVKVQLRFQASGGKEEVETVWALRHSKGFQLDNIPFYAMGFASGDIVAAVPDLDGLLVVTGVVRPSGHSTIRLWFAKDHQSDIAEVRKALKTLGCATELSDMPRLVAVDVPAEVSYAGVKSYLDELEKRGLLEYEEACLGSR